MTGKEKERLLEDAVNLIIPHFASWELLQKIKPLNSSIPCPGMPAAKF